MGSGVLAPLLILSIQILHTLAQTDSNDSAALNAIKSSWNNLPPNWKGADPCGSGWDGITCNVSDFQCRMLGGMLLTGSGLGDITMLTELQTLDLSNNIGLKGTIPSSIGNLKKLSTLILVGCSFSGPIPDSIGSLSRLVYISLNSNSFSGPIPPSIGNLSNLSWLDLSENNLNGTLPVSFQDSPGLDMLLNAKHFHLSKNQLSGVIPAELFSPNMKLIHLYLNSVSLSLLQQHSFKKYLTLPAHWIHTNECLLYIADCQVSVSAVHYTFLSHLKLTGIEITLLRVLIHSFKFHKQFNLCFTGCASWIKAMLATLMLENTTLQGQIPVNFFSLPQLQTVALSNNKLNGTLNIGNSYSNSLALNLQNNSITDFQQKAGYSIELMLSGNPICQGNGAAQRYCRPQTNKTLIQPTNNCASISCSANKILSPNCGCSHPYIGTLHFFSYSFSDLQNTTYYRTLAGSLISALKANGVPVDSVNVSNPSIDVYSYLQFRVQIFPSGQDPFNRTAISTIGFLLNRQTFQLQYFGPLFFLEESYCCYAGEKNSSHTGAIAGGSVGGAVLFMLILAGGFYAYRRKRARREEMKNNPFASWNPDQGHGGVPQLKGARWLTFEELRKCANNFSESNCIGCGGYGKVYKGVLPSGQVVAIKRAQQGSMQGALEFKTEIELLSRIHHKNVVNLVGFCYDQGEQMLVYEYISNGTLRESLLGKSGMQLDWMRRLGIALDAARGLTYLHELASPPIIHRDVKSNNILLDDHFNAKVADFGLSKLLSDEDKGYVSTQVKGTLGYMDPEYYMTQQLTDKSDVYSFGVVMLELMTARAPIERGRHIVRVVQDAVNNPKEAFLSHEILDPKIAPGGKLGGLEKFLDLAMRCVQESGADRPTMGEVVREIENIMQLASLKKSPEADVTTFISKDSTDTSDQHSYGSKDFDYSIGSLPFNIEHHQKNQ
ncbi:unnamed protein product [Coffea canephora]|uniref:non-specific serine/threonine protein kinase n=1 Tax=Coffea canephora TaxID=49390 RepID=A0A068TQS6_COFCA|nr:unnamed protein product [Coffea canephora]